ncbi:PD-(D/E)XK nuclease family protein [Paraburkholderia sp. Ac-20347]|nr:PD-(D/E)XK nuclease family protein [Paraburkholderia sp. Ac-20347]
MANTTESLIDAFFGDTNVMRLVTSSATWEPLRICYPKEVNVSRFIAWLLDPSEGHGLGDRAIQSLLVRAWWESGDVELDIQTRRFLAPSNVQTEGFSAAVVTTEVELAGRSLDVLVVDPGRRRYIAIENKFGSAQSKNQLKHYRKQLEKVFDGFTGVHILLDSNQAEPDHDGWIPVGYDWLAEFLNEAEKRDATASHVRDALRQFRSAIEEESEDTFSRSALGSLITEVAGNFQDVFKLMEAWQRNGNKSTRAQMLVDLMSGTNTLEGKALLRLFQLYWRRPAIWDQCIRQAQFAPFVFAMRKSFSDVQANPKRVRTAFMLGEWDRLIDPETIDADEGFYSPAGVTVRQTGETYRVVTFLQFHDVRIERRDELRQLALDIRAENRMRGSVAAEAFFVALRNRGDLSKEKAIEDAVSQMELLRQRLSRVR